MATPEKKPEMPERAPNLADWVTKFKGDILGAIDVNKEVFNGQYTGASDPVELTLKWMHDTESAKSTFKKEEKETVIKMVDWLKTSAAKQKLSEISASVTDPIYKRALLKLLDYIEDREKFPENTETAPPPGGIPIDSPPTGTPGEGSDKPPSDAPPAPAETDIPPSDTPPAPAETKQTDSQKKAEQLAQTMEDYQKKVRSMSMADLFKELAEGIKGFIDTAKSAFSKLKTTAGGQKFSDKEIDEAKPDFTKIDVNKTYTGDNRDVQYVAEVLHLPPRPGAASFLEALKTSPGSIYSEEKDVTKLQVGDVLFFHDGQDKTKAAVTAIVSELGPPPKMRYVHGTDKAQEVVIDQSDFYNNRWLGSLRVKGKSPSETTPASGQPTDNPADKSADRPAGNPAGTNPAGDTNNPEGQPPAAQPPAQPPASP